MAKVQLVDIDYFANWCKIKVDGKTYARAMKHTPNGGSYVTIKGKNYPVLQR